MSGRREHRLRQLALDRCLQILEEAQMRGQVRVDGPLGAALRRAGFAVDHHTGSHAVLYKPGHPNPVTVPMHTRDLKLGTLRRWARVTMMGDLWLLPSASRLRIS